MEEMDVLKDAEAIVDATDRASILGKIELLLGRHPDGQFLFVMLDEEAEDANLETCSSQEEQGQLYMAQILTHTILNGLWGATESTEE